MYGLWGASQCCRGRDVGGEAERDGRRCGEAGEARTPVLCGHGEASEGGVVPTRGCRGSARTFQQVLLEGLGDAAGKPVPAPAWGAPVLALVAAHVTGPAPVQALPWCSACHPSGAQGPHQAEWVL